MLEFNCQLLLIKQWWKKKTFTKVFLVVSAFFSAKECTLICYPKRGWGEIEGKFLIKEQWEKSLLSSGAKNSNTSCIVVYKML